MARCRGTGTDRECAGSGITGDGQARLSNRQGALPLIAAAGLLDTAANTTFIYAADKGLLTTVSVLSAQYPVITVLLARLVLSERMTARQLWGFLAATVATSLIAAG